MKTNKLFFLFSILLGMLATNASAYDFEVENADGVMIYYSYYGNDNTSVYVTYETDSYNSYSGSVVIPKEVTYNNKTLKVTSIGDSAFSRCGILTSVTIPNSVTSIGEYAFSDCISLQSITIPNSVTSIGVAAFSYCLSLKTITIPNSVTSIGDNAFSTCWDLESVTIPNSMTSIGDYVFWGCMSLASVEIPNSVTNIGSSAFELCKSLKSVTIPNSVTSIGVSPFAGCSALTSIIVEKKNSKYDSRNNCNAIIETNSNTLIMGCKNTVIPNSVTSIGREAFHGITDLKNITIPNSVTTIGEYNHEIMGKTNVEIIPVIA